MRQNKYRAWDKIKNEYVYDDTEYTLRLIEVPNDDTFGGQFFIGFGEYENKRFDMEQYLGTVDKNNKEFCEGDLYIDACGRIKVIRYLESMGCFCGMVNDELGNPVYIDSVADREIIGNIHQNPELLETD